MDPVLTTLRKPSRHGAIALALAVVLANACARAPESPAEPSTPTPIPDDPNPPHALWSKVEEFRADLAAVRSGSDGGGRAWIEWGTEDPARVVVGQRRSFDLVFEVGPDGIANGGQIHFMPEPFWGWSPPQTDRPDRLGFTRVQTDAMEVELNGFSVGTATTGYLVIQVGGRALAAGERVLIQYGVGDSGASVDRHAERGAHLWFYVDGDGDGVRDLIAQSPTVDIWPGPAARLVAQTPSVVRPGETFTLNLAFLDYHGNDGVEFTGSVELFNRPEDWGIPESVIFTVEDGGRKRIEIKAQSSGVLRLGARVQLNQQTVTTQAGPTWVSATAAPIYWGDLHGHSNLSDGTGQPDEWFDYARHTAALDFACLTDHDHFGVQFIDAHPDLWEALEQVAEDWFVPGEFITLPGYEWTSWIHGHRHVVFFGPQGPLLSSVDERYQTPRQLWKGLAGYEALTFAHHSAGDPIPTNWTFTPDPLLEPVTEVMSVHGSSEAPDSPRLLRRPRPGNFVRDVLDSGVPLGFIGSGDSHDGHPGLSHLSPVYGWRPPRPDGSAEQLGTGGLAAVMAPELTRPGLLGALRARSCYATSGPRILMRASLADKPMGAAIPAAQVAGESAISLTILATAPLKSIDLIRSGEVLSLPMQGEMRFMGSLPLTDLTAGEYLYLRITQEDGGLAWSSPFFIE